MFASKALGGRPVKWVEGRRENYQSTIHGRDHITYLEIAGNARRRGHRPAGQDVRQPRRPPVDDRPGHPDDALRPRPGAAATRSRTSTAEVTGVYTNTTFVDAYRGAGRPEATYVIERAMDLFAAEIGMDRAEVRRRNFIQPDQFPYDNPSGLGTAVGGAKIYIDSGNYEPALDKALAMAGYDDLAAKKAEAKARGKLLGIGPLDLHRGLRRRAVASGSAPSARAGAPRCGNRPTSRST